MKFHWFAEATYWYLPKDFPQKYQSAWVDPPRSLLDPRKASEVLNGYLELYEFADEVGFDGLAVNEHHQTAGAMTPSPNLMAAALARTTKDAAMLVIGDSLALYNPPTRVAEEMAHLDVVSNGRLIAGFVYGTPMDSAFSYGTVPSEIRPRWKEAHDLILKAWNSPEPFHWNGKYHKLRYVNIWPTPIQQPLPIWVPGTGSIETWELVTEMDYCYGHLSFAGLHSAKPIVDDYWEFVDKQGGNMNPHRLAFTQLVCVSETDAKAEEEYKEAVEYFYSCVSKVNPGYLMAPGYRSERSIRYELERLRRQATPEQVQRGATAKRQSSMNSTGMTFKDYVDKGFVIAGSPATVRDRLRELLKELRVGQLIATPHMGNLSVEQAKKNTYLFATEVMPHLRDLWSEWEDRWTPQGLAELQREPAVAAAGS